MKQSGKLPENAALVKTIVTTNMVDALSKEYGVNLIEVLTGFKYIGEQIKIFEHDNTYQYLFGFEESYGCLAGTYARDKDAVLAVMMLCEVAAYCESNHMTLWDHMLLLYDKYGYYKEDLVTFTLKGIDGNRKIQRIMQGLRDNQLHEIGGLQVTKIRDYQESWIRSTETQEEEAIELPKSNVLYYELENDAWCCVRPSGTEPKIKFYMGVKEKNLKDAEEKCELIKKELELFITGKERLMV